MEYVKLGNSELRVSRICLGCMGFGDPTIGQHAWTIGEAPTREIIRRSLDLGGHVGAICGTCAEGYDMPRGRGGGHEIPASQG